MGWVKVESGSAVLHIEFNLARTLPQPHVDGAPAAMIGPVFCGVSQQFIQNERERHGTIPGSIHVPYTTLQDNLGSGGTLNELVQSTSQQIVFYCAFGERSAMAVQAAQDAGLSSARHINGGIDAWKKALGPLIQ